MTNNLTLKDFIGFFILSFTAIVIWRLGPQWMIANQYPLIHPEKRFAVIMVLFIAGFILRLTFSNNPGKKVLSTPSSTTPDAVKKLQNLQGRFQGVIEFLKKTTINKNGTSHHLANLPWYAFIGPKNSGKTSLLASSNINFILAKQFKSHGFKAIPPSENCDWWITKDLVILDIPSTYIHSSKKSDRVSPRSVQNVLWHNLLNLIQQHRETQSLNGIILALPLPEILKNNAIHDKKSIIMDMRNQIKELREKFGRTLPCYLVITKCDYLPGFLDYFGDSTNEEIIQHWGMTLPRLQPGEKLLELVSHHFNVLIKRLNKQLIWRLHQERNIHARSNIKDFPLHMERVKDASLQFLKTIMTSDMNLKGIFLTSALQEENPSSDHHTIDHSETQALSLMQAPALPSRAYFVKQLILQGLVPIETSLEIPLEAPPAKWFRPAVYFSAASFVLVTALVLGRDFQQGVQQTHTIQDVLAEYHAALQQNPQPSEHLLKALPMLNALHDTAYNHGLVNLFNFYSAKSTKTASIVYAQALQTILLPQVKNILENGLQLADKNPSEKYNLLKAYLMLNDVSHFDAAFLISIVNQLSNSAFSDETLKQLGTHLTFALKNLPSQNILNTNLITDTRNHFADQSSADLAFLILKNMDDNALDSGILLDLDKDSLVFSTKTKATPILNMFTANAFQTILTHEIDSAANEANFGNWILGDYNHPDNTSNIADQLRETYITNYIATWEAQLDNIELITPKSLSQTDTMLSALTSDHSPLLSLLQTIQQNTAFDVITSKSPKLQGLNTLLANAGNDQSNFLYETFVSLRELDSYLQMILKSSDPLHATFVSTKEHGDTNNDPIYNMRTLSLRVPDPMKFWLSNIANQTWGLMIKDTALYIDKNWQKQIAETYTNQIANRYPFVKNASNEVALDAFIAFLGQRGELANFFQSYLQPFVDISSTDWKFREIDQSKLAIKPEILADYQLLQKIQHTFFPNGDSKLWVQFTLQPMDISENAKTFNLSINGQPLTFTKGNTVQPHALAWPGNFNQDHATSINFITPNNETVSDKFQGDWGWFRLVQNSLHEVPSHKEIVLSFSTKGYTANYQLFTEWKTNPFLTDTLEKFQLPESLLEGA